jgi:6-phosphofructokinase
VIDSLVKRNINQLYMIGGNDTLQYAVILHREIKKKKLNIAICVNLKAINKDIAYFDTCFGF